jgi:hypothetical protein
MTTRCGGIEVTYLGYSRDNFQGQPDNRGLRMPKSKGDSAATKHMNFNRVLDVIALHPKGLKTNQIRAELMKLHREEFSNDKLNDWLKSLATVGQVEYLHKGERYQTPKGIKSEGYTWVLSKHSFQFHYPQIYSCLLLVKSFLPFFIREEKKKDLDNAIKNIGEKLGKVIKSDTTRWLNKLDIANRYPDFHPIDLDNDHNDNKRYIKTQTIHEALYSDSFIEALYDDAEKSIQIYPLGLVRRNNLDYIRANVDGNEQSFALHRLTSVKRIDRNQNSTIAGKVVHKVDPPKLIKNMRLRIKGVATDHFFNVRFAKLEQTDHQIIRRPDDHDENAIILDITNVYLNYELKTWMLGMGVGLEVVNPADVRKWLYEQHKAASRMNS